MVNNQKQHKWQKLTDHKQKELEHKFHIKVQSENITRSSATVEIVCTGSHYVIQDH